MQLQGKHWHKFFTTFKTSRRVLRSSFHVCTHDTTKFNLKSSQLLQRNCKFVCAVSLAGMTHNTFLRILPGKQVVEMKVTE